MPLLGRHFSDIIWKQLSRMVNWLQQTPDFPDADILVNL